MTTQTGQCACGRVKVTVENEPFLVGAGHCDFCQKRTGSVFAVSAYFSPDQCVEISGETKVYNGLEVEGIGSTSGEVINYHFCATCGSTVYWTVEGPHGPAVIGIAVGNFVDPDFAASRREYYAKLRHRWLPPVPPPSSSKLFLTKKRVFGHSEADDAARAALERTPRRRCRSVRRRRGRQAVCSEMSSPAPDRDQVFDVLKRYAEAADLRDWSLYDKVFARDATADYGVSKLAAARRSWS